MRSAECGEARPSHATGYVAEALPCTARCIRASRDVSGCLQIALYRTALVIFGHSEIFTASPAPTRGKSSIPTPCYAITRHPLSHGPVMIWLQSKTKSTHPWIVSLLYLPLSLELTKKINLSKIFSCSTLATVVLLFSQRKTEPKVTRRSGEGSMLPLLGGQFADRQVLALCVGAICVIAASGRQI